MSKFPVASLAGPSAAELLQHGLELHQSGRADEAAPFYMRALEREPDNAAANHLLGLVHLGKGDAELAVTHIARAVAAKPDDAQFLCNLGVALNAASRDEKAVEVLRRAVTIAPDFAEAHSNLGMVYRALLRFDEAVESYRRAVELKPNHAGFHFNLGNALGGARDLAQAEVAYRKALELRPNHPGAANALAILLGERFLCDEGLQIADAALAAAPFESQLHGARARLLQKLGRLHEALAAYDRAIEYKPGAGEPLHHRALLLRQERRDEGVAAMEKLFADRAAATDDRVYAGFGLGRALANIGEHEASVETFLAVNRMHRNRIEFSLERAINALQGDLDRGAAAPTAAAGDKADHIFVVGLPRAGKSTVEAVLSQHPETVRLGELPTLGRLFDNLMHDHPRARLSEFAHGELEGLGAAYIAEAERYAVSGRVTIDTMPSNFRLVGVIAAALPRARIIWCHRDPLEHCIAIFEKYFTGLGHEYAYDLAELVPYHAAYRPIMLAWEQLLPGRILPFDVAALHQDRIGETRRLLDFCGLQWDERCLGQAESEPTLGEWSAERASAHHRDHMAAWRAAWPTMFHDNG